MIRETSVQSQVASYQRLLKWDLIPPCLTLSNIRYVSRVKWSNPRKGVAPSPTPQCSSYWKGSLLVANFTYLIIITSLLESFSNNVSWWSFTEVRATASLLWSPGLFSVFLPISTMLWSVCSRLLLWSPIPLVFFPSLLKLFVVHQLQLVLPSPSCNTSFFFPILWQEPSFVNLFAFFLFTMEQQNPLNDMSLSRWLIQGIVFWTGFVDPFLSLVPREFSASCFREQFWFVRIPFDSMVKF